MAGGTGESDDSGIFHPTEGGSMNICGDSVVVAHPLFQEEGGGSIPTSPLQLNIGQISANQFSILNRLWHSRLPQAENCFEGVCYGAEFDGVFYAVAWWSKPIARLLNGRGWFELRRLAIGPNAPKNTASRMLKVMRLMVIKKYPDVCKLISYQDTSVHAGTIYGASGWKPVETIQSFNNWDTPARRRNRPTPETVAPKKIRWEWTIRAGTANAISEAAELAPIQTKNMELFAGHASDSISAGGAESRKAA